MTHTAFSQSNKQVRVYRTAQPIIVDGVMDEETWQQADVATAFVRNFPDDQNLAEYQTFVRMLFDEEHLYLFLRMERNPDADYSVSTLREDFTFYDGEAFYENDAVGIILDPFTDFTNGYGFYVNAYGAKRDEQISGGTVSDETLDLRWSAEVVREDDYYTVEIALPLEYIRHGGGTVWNINVVRNDAGANERSAWVRVPINFSLNNLAFTGRLLWDTERLEAGSKLYSLIPSLTFSESKEAGEEADYQLKPSLDAKISLASSLNMDVTINPDFSQAEVDEQQVNLTRFNLEFPENRQFFIENSDLFSSFGDVSWGNPPIRPFYSRQIGLRYDSLQVGYVPVGIYGGARVSGKLNDNLRIGAMSIQTRQEKLSSEAYSPSENYSVLALQQRLFARSNVSVMYTNRQSFGTDTTDEFALNKSEYDRVLAGEFNFASTGDTYSGKLYHHVLFGSANENAEYARGALLNHNTSQWRNWLHVTQISPNFKPRTGFVPRTDVFSINTHVAYSFYPERGVFNQVELLVNPQFFMDADGSYSDHFSISGLHAITRNTQDIWLVHIQERIELKEPFDPTFENDVKLEPGLKTTFNYIRFAYGSDRRRKFFWSSNIDVGEYYTGSQVRFEGAFRYRMQPHGSVTLNYNIGRFDLPDPFEPAYLFFVAPKIEYAFSRKVFLTSVVQYQSQADNFNYYLRFQWRYRPLSDFYVVYSGNMNTENESFSFTNHGLVVKAQFWF